ncbi:putative protein OS=Streptomyces microflavus OX=1919 GN=Smic_37260 PE=4 SV=1 [Streptomyces microflavus]
MRPEVVLPAVGSEVVLPVVRPEVVLPVVRSETVPTVRPAVAAARRTPGAAPSGAQITASTAGSVRSRASVVSSASCGVAANGTVRSATATPCSCPQEAAVARRAVAQAEVPAGARTAGWRAPRSVTWSRSAVSEAALSQITAPLGVAAGPR